MKKNISTSLFQKEQVLASIKQSFVKLDPRMMIKNPIMFTVEVVTLLGTRTFSLSRKQWREKAPPTTARSGYTHRIFTPNTGTYLGRAARIRS